MPMDIHKQAMEKISASKIWKQLEALWDFVYTPSCIFHSFTQAAFYVYLDFTGKKS